MSALLDTLHLMLTYARPMGSRAEARFIRRFIATIGATPDRHGNWIATIGDAPQVLWSCHTDTVHTRQGRQVVVRDDRHVFRLPDRSRSNCLGADDTAGVFILTEMIKRRVPGRYVFHFGEERGCIGSSALVEDHPAWLNEITMAIALDRKGTTDVITHQGIRTASDQFAQELADAIGLGYEPSDRGIYTDTERYAGIVPECTNLSIGYEGAHSPDETLDGLHVLALLDRLCALDLATIGVYRDPTVPDPDELRSWGPDWRTYDDADFTDVEDDLDDLVRDDRRDDTYLDPDFADVAREYRRLTQYDQKNLWDRSDPETDRQDRLQRELERYFRDMGLRQAALRYTKGPKRSQ
jgi:hypothetical protein